MKTPLSIALSALWVLTLSVQAAEPSGPASQLERGRYLARIGGCNDCHTPGYPESGGKTPESQWLTGNPVGFQGPWGTSYPANLRLLATQLTDAQWKERCRQTMRPPMPWFNLQAMSDRDLGALYRFIRSLGPAGAPAPQAKGPGEAPGTAYIDFTPKNLAAVAGR